MSMRVVVLGAGFGGLELASRLVREGGDAFEVTVVDQGEGFVFGFAKLDVMFGRALPEEVVHPYRRALPGARFVSAEVLAIDPVERRVETSAGSLDADVLVVALGADLDPGATPGLVEGGYEFYTVAGAFALRDVLPRFDGGKVVVGVTSTPFKCPPAPSEAALLVHDFLVDRGLRDASEVSLVMPFGLPIPPSPQASAVLLEAFRERGIQWVPEVRVTALDPDRRMALLSDGAELPYDLFLGIPVHRAPEVVLRSELAEDGWVPVDRLTLETRFPDVYAVGDVTSVGTPKAGVFAEGQATIVANRLLAQVGRGSDQAVTTYDGRGLCYLEMGHGTVAKVDVTFEEGLAPTGSLEGPSAELVADKSDFGSSRVARWFGRHDES